MINVYMEAQNKFLLEKIRIMAKQVEDNLKKQEGNYEDLYFNYGLNYDLRNSAYRTTSGNKTAFYQALPIVSGNNEITNTFIFTQYKTLDRSSDLVGKASLYLKAVNSLDNSDVRISKRVNVPYSRLRGFQKGKIGEFYNIGSNKNLNNIEVCKKLLKVSKNLINLGQKVKITFVKDRPGHDVRYALDSNKIKKNLKWYPKTKFEEGIKLTFDWYNNNKTYYKSLSKKDIIKRLGKQ